MVESSLFLPAINGMCVFGIGTTTLMACVCLESGRRRYAGEGACQQQRGMRSRPWRQTALENRGGGHNAPPRLPPTPTTMGVQHISTPTMALPSPLADGYFYSDVFHSELKHVGRDNKSSGYLYTRTPPNQLLVNLGSNSVLLFSRWSSDPL